MKVFCRSVSLQKTRTLTKSAAYFTYALLELKLGCTYPGQFPARQVAAPPENHRDSLTRFEQRPTRQHPRPLLRPKLVRYVLKSSNDVIVGSFCHQVVGEKLDTV